MSTGIGKFYCFQKRNPQPATFFENHFLYVGGVGEGMEKAGLLFGVGLPFFVLYLNSKLLVCYKLKKREAVLPNISIDI